MSVKFLAWARDDIPGLSKSQRAVLNSLAFHANDYGCAWPSIATLARETGYHRVNVMRAVVALEAARIIKADRANGRSNRYTINPQPDLWSGRAMAAAQRHPWQSATRDNNTNPANVTGNVTGNATANDGQNVTGNATANDGQKPSVTGNGTCNVTGSTVQPKSFKANINKSFTERPSAATTEQGPNAATNTTANPTPARMAIACARLAALARGDLCDAEPHAPEPVTKPEPTP